MLVTLLCDRAMQGTSACAFFLHLNSQNKLTIKYVLQFLTESGHQVTKFVPCWPAPVHEILHSCIAVRQADKEPNSCRCNCPNRNYSTCTSIALKVPKDIKKRKEVKYQPGPLPLQHTPIGTVHACCCLRISFVRSNGIWQEGFCIYKLKVHTVNRALLLQLVGAFFSLDFTVSNGLNVSPCRTERLNLWVGF